MERHEEYEKEFIKLERVDNWINNCDSKTSIILAFIGIVFTILLTSNFILESLNQIFQSIRNNEEWFFSAINWGYIVIVVLFLITLYKFSFSIYYLINVLIANDDIKKLKCENELSNINSNIHFKKISEKTFEAFKSDCCSDYDIINDIHSQIYINSLICSRKFDSYKKSVKKLKWGLLFLLLFIMALIIFI